MITGLTNDQQKQLELEVVSHRARVRLTRILRARLNRGEHAIIFMNRAINIARTAQGLPIYVLEADDMGDYHPAEYAWHNGELELVMRRPDAAHLAEILADLVRDSALNVSEVNRILKEENVSFRLVVEEDGEDAVDNVRFEIFADSDIPPADVTDQHPNVRALCRRMDVQLGEGDSPGVLHTAATIFETVAKDVVRVPTVQDQTLKSFFEKYRKESRLPRPVLDFILDVYDRRNKEALAGHGKLSEPKISTKDAIALAEITKAFIRIERQLADLEIAPEAKRAVARSGSGSAYKRQAVERKK